MRFRQIRLILSLISAFSSALPVLIFAIVILLAMDGFNPAGPHEMGIYSRFALTGAVLAVITWLLPTKSKANPSETSENDIKE